MNSAPQPSFRRRAVTIAVSLALAVAMMYEKFVRYGNYLGNALCVVDGFHIGLLLLSGQHWYGPVIAGQVIKTATHIIGEELILGKDQDALAIMVLHAMLIGTVTVFFLSLLTG